MSSLIKRNEKKYAIIECHSPNKFHLINSNADNDLFFLIVLSQQRNKEIEIKNFKKLLVNVWIFDYFFFRFCLFENSKK